MAPRISLLVAALFVLAALQGADAAAPTKVATGTSKHHGGGLTDAERHVQALRLAMLKWYCTESTGHANARPCQNYNFMLKLKAVTDPEQRKKMVSERAQTMPSDEAGKKEYAAQAKEGFLSMYTSYCARKGLSGDASTQHDAVCADAGLKKMYEAYAAGGAKGKTTK